MQKKEQSKEKKNEFIIAGKPDFLYLGHIANVADEYDEIILKSIRKYLGDTEYIILKLKCLGFEEKERKQDIVIGVGMFEGKKLDVVNIRMEKIPALKAIRERLVR